MYGDVPMGSLGDNLYGLGGGDVGVCSSGNRKLLAPVADKAVRYK